MRSINKVVAVSSCRLDEFRLRSRGCVAKRCTEEQALRHCPEMRTQVRAVTQGRVAAGEVDMAKSGTRTGFRRRLRFDLVGLLNKDVRVELVSPAKVIEHNNPVHGCGKAFRNVGIRSFDAAGRRVQTASADGTCGRNDRNVAMELQRFFEVEQAVTIDLVHACITQIVCGVEDQVHKRAGLQIGKSLEQNGKGTGYNGRRNGRAAALSIVGAFGIRVGRRVVWVWVIANR